MKVVIINTSERIGGAAVAANRLMHALRMTGVDVKMLVRDKQTNDGQVISVNDTFAKRLLNRFRFLWERGIIFLNKKCKRENLFKLSIADTGVDLSKMSLIKEADIIHLHWINQGFLSIRDIEELEKLGKPIVWTMHDMWPFTGICHHARECDNYQRRCGHCFFLDSTKERDLSEKVFSEKKELFEYSGFTFVGCSKWLTALAQKSNLLLGKEIVAIPNPIDMELFYPMGKRSSREELNLPSDKQLLLFGALNVTDKRKGIEYLVKALDYLREINPQLYKNMGLVVFGQVKDEIKNLFSVPVYPMGYLDDSEKIVTLYNAVDLFVTSSLEENLPNTIMEAMTCGTPCVGFNIGGIPEMIEHKKNGYVAEYMSAEDLAQGLDWVLNNSGKDELRYNCMEKVKKEYASAIIAGKYIALYQRLLKKPE
ncbi:MAG: glycosyltransferase family 4 protein [Bacteroidales bacterium]|nr:glycosyltransferase family 4 protein [Bacteroidales bacterium]